MGNNDVIILRITSKCEGGISALYDTLFAMGIELREVEGNNITVSPLYSDEDITVSDGAIFIKSKYGVYVLKYPEEVKGILDKASFVSYKQIYDYIDEMVGNKDTYCTSLKVNEDFPLGFRIDKECYTYLFEIPVKEESESINERDNSDYEPKAEKDKSTVLFCKIPYIYEEDFADKLAELEEVFGVEFSFTFNSDGVEISFPRTKHIPVYVGYGELIAKSKYGTFRIKRATELKGSFSKEQDEKYEAACSILLKKFKEGDNYISRSLIVSKDFPIGLEIDKFYLKQLDAPTNNANPTNNAIPTETDKSKVQGFDEPKKETSSEAKGGSSKISKGVFDKAAKDLVERSYGKTSGETEDEVKEIKYDGSSESLIEVFNVLTGLCENIQLNNDKTIVMLTYDHQKITVNIGYTIKVDKINHTIQVVSNEPPAETAEVEGLIEVNFHFYVPDDFKYRTVKDLIDVLEKRGVSVDSLRGSFIEKNSLRDYIGLFEDRAGKLALFDGFRCKAFEPLLESLVRHDVASEEDGILEIQCQLQVGIYTVDGSKGATIQVSRIFEENGIPVKPRRLNSGKISLVVNGDTDLYGSSILYMKDANGEPISLLTITDADVSSLTSFFSLLS